MTPGGHELPLATPNNLCEHLKTAALSRPDDLAVARQLANGEFEELTLAQLERLSDRIALALREQGIVGGMKAVLMVTPGLEFFALTFALFKAGIIPVMVDPGMGTANLKTCLAKARPDVFIGIPKAQLARRLLGWGKETVQKVVTVGGSGIWGGKSLKRMLADVSVDAVYQPQLPAEDQLCAILYTSGSTGEPKGVEYTHTMFNAQIQSLKQDYGIKPGERDLATFPLFALFGPALGMASIIPDMDASRPITADPEVLLRAVERYRCTNLFLNPALLAKLANYPGNEQEEASIRTRLASVQRVISAGAPADIGQITRLRKLLADGVEVLNSYGATEALPVSMFPSSQLASTAPQTDTGGGICVGYPVAAEIRIARIDNGTIGNVKDAEWLSEGQIGEIWVKGAVASAAYYDNPAATSKAKVADGTEFWHRMGDVGYLDSMGRLWMCGRMGHRVCGAEKTWFTLPCERIFNTHPGVIRTALVAVEIEGSITPVLCVELAADVYADTVFSQLATLSQEYSHTLGINHFIQHDGFPMDVRHNAKIFREKLAQWAQKRWQKAWTA
ncbi:AMP-binding protein [Shewanella corallii]|uniref:AMP-binding protein n=1 Tax=Shewanella corallii TaxID=560080 RepID=A0ABT0N477_9GAMM|nr:fatty acid CoA ligase family protein [Shewanella corallii]MCL2913223.1 AMP-binding protein [Shewanella corallii]